MNSATLYDMIETLKDAKQLLMHEDVSRNEALTVLLILKLDGLTHAVRELNNSLRNLDSGI